MASGLTRQGDTNTPWRTASACGGGGCVEVAAIDGSVAVRDSKDPQSPILTFTRDEWIAFADGLRRGEFDDLA